ncbi:MarR family winged helix-turn-helix transcriptional regulator [Luteimicrobium subarcticum]|nr:MarR family transcriptional regulator [Luteimicrobium subarcticum]
MTPDDLLPTSEVVRDRRVAWLLTLVNRHQHVIEQRIELNSADMRLLWLFNDHRARTLREIADDLSLEQSTVNRQVNAALTAGLLRRFSEPGRSARLVEPTERGRTLFERDIADALGTYEQALDRLGDDAAPFLDLLTRFTSAFGDAVHTLPER